MTFVGVRLAIQSGSGALGLLRSLLGAETLVSAMRPPSSKRVFLKADDSVMLSARLAEIKARYFGCVFGNLVAGKDSNPKQN